MFPSLHRRRRLLACGWLAVVPVPAADLPGLAPAAWSVAEQRCGATVAWMTTTHGSPAMHARYPNIGSFSTPGRWITTGNLGDWHDGFWPGTLWLLAQRTGSTTWRQRATDWSGALANTTSTDHDIGFIVMSSLGKGWLFHDELNDPGGTYRAFVKEALTVAAGKLDSRFNLPFNGVPVPAQFIRSWDSIEAPYPVCIDNLMNLELLFAAYELNGRLPEHRPWFDHALLHARNTIAHHLRADGGSYHVVKHFESGPQIGQIERKSTRQGYSDETTWSRGQAWGIHGFTTIYRHARRDPGTDASDLLAAAETCADYFLDHLPDAFTADPYNHRASDFVPPSDFQASLGEPDGPWNDANGNYDSSSGSGLGDAKGGTGSFTARDSSAAAVAASGLIELSGYSENGGRYLAAAEDILACLIAYDGPDDDSAPDYFCAANDTENPGILKLGSRQWNASVRSLIYGDYYFLEALTRYEALRARELLASTQSVRRNGGDAEFEFQIQAPAPALCLRVERSTDLVTWATVAAKTGNASWTGSAAVDEAALPGNRTRVTVTEAAPAGRGFFRVVTRSLGDGIPP